MLIRTVIAAVLVGFAASALAEPENTHWPNYQEGDFIIRDYQFANGQSLPQLKLHYRTLGSAERNAAGEIVNGVLLLQGNTGTGANWLRPTLADELFKDGQPLDAAHYFIIIPDALGRGGSSKPSDGLKGNFPHYRYHDMVDSTHRLVTEGLKVAHLRLVIGSSLGCMHSFMWAETYPDLMDGTVGLSCQPVEISGRNWISRRAAAEAIRHDPDWNNGNYDKNPTHYIYSAAAGSFMPESAARIQEMAPTRAAADKLYDERVARVAKGDANNSLWAIEVDRGLQPRGRSSQDHGQGAADQHGRGRRQPARAGHGRARDEGDSRRPLRADPIQRPDAWAFHPLLRRGVEALSDQLYGVARPGRGGAVNPSVARPANIGRCLRSASRGGDAR